MAEHRKIHDLSYLTKENLNIKELINVMENWRHIDVIGYFEASFRI